jgi:sterol desaturase/sphingolipid hydroxylase (fatty acid hydroxylase superfamily)
MGEPFVQACQAALVLLISHGLCVLIIMYYDLSGRWSEYSINKHRSVTLYDYWVGWRSFCVDLVLMFVPFMTACFTYSAKRINDSQDDVMTAATKLVGGYVLGKLWAFVVHYALHFPWLYHFHRKHHLNPRKIVASAAWQDSFVEYAVMELPSLAITVLLFPTHFPVLLLHFCWHGWDGACGHSGFSAPGFLGLLFDGEYHYYHHCYLTVNYAEIEVLDKFFGTHHSQRKKTLSQ